MAVLEAVLCLLHSPEVGEGEGELVVLEFGVDVEGQEEGVVPMVVIVPPHPILHLQALPVPLEDMRGLVLPQLHLHSLLLLIHCLVPLFHLHSPPLSLLPSKVLPVLQVNAFPEVRLPVACGVGIFVGEFEYHGCGCEWRAVC